MERISKLKEWLGCLEEIENEFPGENTCIGTAIGSFKSQLKALEKQ